MTTANVPEFKLEEVPAELVFTIEHTFNASAADLYQAFITEEKLIRWFGPEGWSVPAESAEIDPRVGGIWKFTMVNNEDPTMVSPSNAVFVALEPNKLIEGAERMPAPSNTNQDGAASNDGGPSYLYMRTEFIEEGKNTRLKITQGPLPTEFHEPGAVGWKSSFTKLEKVLAD